MVEKLENKNKWKKIYPNITINNKAIPSSYQIKYLGLILDKRLTWGPLLKTKGTRQTSLHKLRPLSKSKLNLRTKLSIFKTIIRPNCSNGIQIKELAKPSAIRPIQAHQNIVPRLITDASWYISNASLYKNLNIPTVKELASTYYHITNDSFPNSTHTYIPF